MPDYHKETAYHRQAMGGHTLDWSEQPHPFKEYLNREPMPLPEPRPPRADFFELALGLTPETGPGPSEPDAADLAAVMLMSAGVTSRTGHHLGLRAPASAGALYPAELYAVACGVQGIGDGIYHFDPATPGLHSLQEGCLAGLAARCLGRPPSRLTFFITAYFWRSLWKYRSRAFRYCLLDSGHMLANLELALSACGLTPKTTADFVDTSVGVMLGLASQDEAPLAAVQTPELADQCQEGAGGLPPMDLQAKPLSSRIGRDPQVKAAHSRGILDNLPSGKRTWLFPRPSEGALELVLPDPPRAGVLETIRSRRSRRNFLKIPLEESVVSVLLKTAQPKSGPCQATVMLAPGAELEGGAYIYIPGMHLLQPISVPGDRRSQMAQACLDQMWMAGAALILVLWADLGRLADIGGPRTYRHAMLEAGRIGQRLYLAATALGLGCCGIGAFYDEEAAAAASLPQNAEPLYLLACGPVKGWPG